MRYLAYNLVAGASMLLRTWYIPFSTSKSDALAAVRSDAEHALSVARCRAAAEDIAVDFAMRKNFRELVTGMVLATILSLALLLSVVAIVVRQYVPGADLPWWLYCMACAPTVMLLSAVFLEKKLRPAILG